MYHISRRVGKTWDSLTQYIRRIEQLAAIRKTQELPTETQELEGKTQELPEYTPPEGWRVLAVGEELREGDVIVHADDAMYATARAGKVVQANQRYIRPIEPEPQPEPESVWVCEGWWRTKAGEIVPVKAMPTGHPDFSDAYPWWDGDVATWANNGVFFNAHEMGKDLAKYLGTLGQPKPQPEPETKSEQWADIEKQADTEYTPPEGWRVLAVGERLRDGDMAVNKNCYGYPTDRVGYFVGSNKRYIRRIEPQAEPQPEPNTAAIEELRSEVSYVQRLLGESRQRVTHLEELVASLRTINEGQEKAFNAANKANDDLQHRLDVVSKEWADQAATSNGLRAQLDRRNAQMRDLQIELDALRQVPADSTPMTNNDVISRSDAVDAVVLAAVEHVVAIVARLHNTQVTPELHNTIVQAIGQLTAQSPEQHDEAIPPVVAEHCDAMPALVQSVFYNIPDAG